uniref:Uncharacterized protein n=1 Tax=Parascaris univalens TaxID=6257 RepID=A0A915A143_PARUN
MAPDMTREIKLSFKYYLHLNTLSFSIYFVNIAQHMLSICFVNIAHFHDMKLKERNSYNRNYVKIRFRWLLYIADEPTITMGARADSYHKYLLEQWIQTVKSMDW